MKNAMQKYTQYLHIIILLHFAFLTSIFLAGIISGMVMMGNQTLTFSKEILIKIVFTYVQNYLMDVY